MLILDKITNTGAYYMRFCTIKWSRSNREPVEGYVSRQQGRTREFLENLYALLINFTKIQENIKIIFDTQINFKTINIKKSNNRLMISVPQIIKTVTLLS